LPENFFLFTPGFRQVQHVPKLHEARSNGFHIDMSPNSFLLKNTSAG
jgi:hypothetical protein